MTEQEKKEPIKVFQLNDEKAEFEELELEPDVKLYEEVDPYAEIDFL